MSLADRQPAEGSAVERSMVAARAGSFSALGQLLDHYRDYLLRIAQEELASDLAVKVAPSDLVQDTFVQATRDFPRFRGTTEGELRAWLRQALLHNLRDAARRWKGTDKRAGAGEIPLDVVPADSPPEATVLFAQASASARLRSAEERQQVHDALARLTPEHRQVIELRTFEGLSFAETGAAMNRSSEAARKLWARAIERLAEELGDATGHGEPRP